jgi:metallo-beta-lactamase family protein
MRLTFHGGAGEVTGANYLLSSQGVNILVDCGMEQGSRFCELRNCEPFPYDPHSVEAVFVTHAHIDHVGRLPKLLRDGFRGTVYSTPPTRDFAELLLYDSEHVIRNELGGSALLYTSEDISLLMERWSGIEYHQPLKVGPFTVTLYDAGHILGSSFIVVEAEGKRVVFSGDLGNPPTPIIKPTEYMDSADYCLLESTYGNRIHEDFEKRKDILEDTIEDTVKGGGVLLIPAFAMERTQELIFELNELVEQGRIPKVPIFIDSPLAIKLTAIYQKYQSYFNQEAWNRIKSGDAIFNFPGLRMTLTTEQSKEINNVPPPKVIIAGSGMSQGGRILHHERRYLQDPKNTILFIGYQARGSLGRRIYDGAETVRIFGEEIPVRLKRIAIGGYSAHADQPKLIDWVSHMRSSLKRVFVVQGEEDAANALAQKIKDGLAVDAVVPKIGESYEL